MGEGWALILGKNMEMGSYNLEFWVLKVWSFRNENNLAEEFLNKLVKLFMKISQLVPVRLQTQKGTEKERKPIQRLSYENS